MSKEKRRQKRLDANLFSDLAKEASGELLGRGVVVDVSVSGVAIETEADLSVNDTIICHIEVPLVLHAKVVRRQSQGAIRRYGLQFIHQSIFDRLLFKKVLKGPRRTRRLR